MTNWKLLVLFMRPVVHWKVLDYVALMLAGYKFYTHNLSPFLTLLNDT